MRSEAEEGNSNPRELGGKRAINGMMVGMSMIERRMTTMMYLTLMIIR